MLALGYPTSIKMDIGGFSGKPVYKIRLLNRTYAARWVEEIGFIGARKSAAVKLHVSRTGQGDLIPVTKDMLDELVPISSDKRASALMSYGRHQALTRDMVAALCPDDKEMKRRLGYFYDEVVKADMDDVAVTYDLSVPENVTYVANGFVSHNTISNLPGTTSGCQPIYAKHFIRRVNFASNDKNLVNYKKFPIEDSRYTKNTKVVSFFCKDPLVASCEKRGVDTSLIEEQREISLADHLAVQAMLQDDYADNCISYTINFDPSKVKPSEIERALLVHLPHLKGTTLMPEGESRPQMPFQRISDHEFSEAEKKGLAMVSDAERACANGACPIK
jgi:hypothetical protein